jgi:dTDP-4-amino-4,6-dideoxygalactose transaminase
MLVVQLEDAARIQAARHAAWATYQRELAGWAERHGVVQPTLPAGAEHPAHLYWLVLPSPAAQQALRAHLAARGIQAASHYQPLHCSTMGLRHGGQPGSCPVTERVADSLLRLPLYGDITAADVERVVDAVQTFAI